MLPTTTTIPTASKTELPLRRGSARARMLTVLATAGAALLGWLIVGPLLGVELNVRIGTGTAQRVGPTSVVIAGLVAAAAGWLLLAALERLTSRARSGWTIVALTVFVVSLVGLASAVSPASKTALVFLHLIVAAVLIPGLRRSTGAAVSATVGLGGPSVPLGLTPPTS